MPAHHAHSLRLRLLSVALLPLLVAIGLFALYFVQRTSASAEAALQARGQDAVQRLAEGIAFDLFTGNLGRARHLVELERSSLGAELIAVADGNVWAVASGRLDLLHGARAPSSAISRQGRYYVFARQVGSHLPAERAGADLIAASPALHGAPQVVLVLSRAPVERARVQTILAALGMGLVSLTIALALTWRLAARVSRPIQRVTQLLDRLAQGHLTVRIAEDAPAELGQLQRGVNLLAMRLEESQRVLEQRVLDATAELRSQKALAESATHAKSRFLAAASHDLRQPLHALALLAETLQERAPAGEAQHLAGYIASSVQAMERLLNALLDLSRLDAGVVTARTECLPLRRVLDGIGAQFMPVAQAQGIGLRIRHTALWTTTDPALLERILANLVGNALRYTRHGRVLVGVRRVGAQQLRLEVWDTGCGIAPEHQARVFEEYFQLDNPERHRDKGLGLGLAIVRRLARLLGTEVELRSRPGRGSCFRLHLARCAPGTEPALPEPPAGAVALPLEQALVAFIDDDPSILEAMVEMFDHWGVALAAGEHGDQVLRELLELGRAPDIILSDYRLGAGRTGIEAIQSLRAVFGPVPAALLTGDIAVHTLNEIEACGLPVLHKPLKPARLRAFLSHLLAESAALPRPPADAIPQPTNPPITPT